jgi:hypothetical protein
MALLVGVARAEAQKLKHKVDGKWANVARPKACS